MDGLLHFEYREDEPGSVPAHVTAYSTLIIPVHDTPVRIIAKRDGHTERFTMQQDDIAVALAGVETSWEWLDATKVILLHVDPQVMRRFALTELKVVVQGGQFDDAIFFHDADIRSAAERMLETLADNDLGSSVVFDALARMFLVQMVKRYGQSNSADVRLDRHFDARQYTQVVTYIEDHLGEKLTPAQLASEIGMSEAAFSRKFKAKVGETPMRFVTQMRLQIASRLVGGGVMPLAQIAAECGFADQAHLSRSFKQQLGVSPSQFRAEHTRASPPQET